MAMEDRFKQSAVVTLAQRVAKQFFNPDCGEITSGPPDDPGKAVINRPMVAGSDQW